MKSQVGRWSVVNGGLCALLVLSLVTTLTFRVTSHLRYSVGWTGANIYGHWILLTCSLITGVLAIAMGIRASQVSGGIDRRLGHVGLTLGMLSLGGLAVWECSGWWFSLFWDI
jgi:hypothetical protein